MQHFLLFHVIIKYLFLKTPHNRAHPSRNYYEIASGIIAGTG